MLYIFIWMISGVIIHHSLIMDDLTKDHKVEHSLYFASLILSAILGPVVAPLVFIKLKQGGYL